MIILSAFLMSLMIGLVVWFILRILSHRQLIGQRVTGLEVETTAKATPLSVEGLFKTQKKKLFAEDSSSAYAPPTFSHTIIQALSWASPVVLLIYFFVTERINKNWFILMILATIGFFIVAKALRRMREIRTERKILRALPQFVDLLVIAMEAGLSFLAALEKILKELDKDDLLTRELNRMNNEILSGVPLTDACNHLNKRCQISDLNMLMNSITQSNRMGGSLAKTLRVQAAEIRDKYKQRIRMRALQIPVKVLFPMMPIFMAFLMLNFSIIIFQMQKVMVGKEPSPTFLKEDTREQQKALYVKEFKR